MNEFYSKAQTILMIASAKQLKGKDKIYFTN